MRARAVRIAVAATWLLAGVAAGPADAAEEPAPNTGRLSLSAGVDFPTDYYFRGIVQETEDYIIQPYAELTIKLFESKTPLTALALTLGTWNSLHGGPTGLRGSDESGVHDPEIWYESDFYAKLSFMLFEDLTAGVIYTAYMSPNGKFSTVEEVAFSLAYADSKLLGPFALNPSVLLAIETSGQADAGRDEGVYLQLGLAPGYTFNAGGTYPVALTFPLVVGLSLDDYYERVGVGGDDDTYGYFSGGVGVSVPLAFIPRAFGTWQAKASVNVLHLGDNLRAANRDDDLEIVGSFGIALTY
jgi:hypothetical protein